MPQPGGDHLWSSSRTLLWSSDDESPRVRLSARPPSVRRARVRAARPRERENASTWTQKTRWDPFDRDACRVEHSSGTYL